MNHFELLIQQLKKIEFTSILEVGCGQGHILRLLAKEFPKVKITAIDINSNVLFNTKNNLEKEGITNIKLSVGKAENLKFDSNSFDVVLSAAVLIYVDRFNISLAFSEMNRVARKAILLEEWHSENTTAFGDKDFGHWKRNYYELAEPYSFSNIHLSKIPPTIWKDRNWKEWGWHILYEK